VLPQPLVNSFAAIIFLLAVLALAKAIFARRKRHNRQMGKGAAE
jgi:hypothetical protein